MTGTASARACGVTRLPISHSLYLYLARYTRAGEKKKKKRAGTPGPILVSGGGTNPLIASESRNQIKMILA